MATLILPTFEVNLPIGLFGGAHSLASWLSGDWALVFSHPRDFAEDGFENDRWLSILRDEFIDRGVRPLAVSHSPFELDHSWVSQVIVDDSVLTVSDNAADGGAQKLAEQLQTQDGHYVAIVDPELEQRGVLRYVQSFGARLSPLDMLTAIDAMRQRTGPFAAFARQLRRYIPC